MLEILNTLFNFLIQNNVSFILSISIIILLVAALLGIKTYGKNYIIKLIHRRNLCWLIAWLVSLSVLLFYQYLGIWSKIPAWLGIALIIIYGAFTTAVFVGVNTTLFFSNHYIKKYRKERDKGYVFENKNVTQKRPWYFLDANERIQYTFLKASYLQQLGDIQAAYDTYCEAEKLPMYPEEQVDCNLYKSYLLIEMGDLQNAKQILATIKNNDNPAYLFLYSYILENEGKLDEAFKLAKEAENSLTTSNSNANVRLSIYNHLGRLYCFRGNQTEVYRYYKLAINQARKIGEMFQIHLTYQNLIDQYMQNDFPEEDIRHLAEEYLSYIDSQSVDGICQIINLKVRIARHFKDKNAEEAAIYQGYEALKKHSEYPALALNRVQILHMLFYGRFDLDQLLTDIEKDLPRYSQLSMPQRVDVHLGLAHFIDLQSENLQRFDTIKSTIYQYLNGNALKDIDTYYNSLPSNCVNLRCHLIESKIDICVLMQKHANKQLELHRELRQLYEDSNLMLKKALANVGITKYYGQQCMQGYILTEDDKNEIALLLEEASNIAEHLPWIHLGNLLVEIASAYTFFQNKTMAKLTLQRFESLGLSEKNCDLYQQKQLEDLRLEYNH